MKKAAKKPIKKSTKTQSCDCIESINKGLQLRESNTRLSEDRYIDMSTGKSGKLKVRLAVEKEDSKKREPLKRIIPIYCPFCGQRY